MISVVATCFVKEDKIELFLKLSKELVMETQKEPGCIEYNLYSNEKAPREFTYIEKWESKENLDAHMISKHFKRIGLQMSGTLEKETSMYIYNEVF